MTEKVRRRPYSVILFDEIEKAHPDVFNVLLQILEDGRLTDSHGRTINFKNTVIIMTSNLGQRDIQKGTSVGFGGDSKKLSYEKMKEKVNSELKKHFRPELLNRIDDVIVFQELTDKDIIKIVDLMMSRLQSQLQERGLEIELTKKAKKFLAGQGFSPTYGARPLRRAIQRNVEDPLSEKLLAGEYKPGQTIVADLDKDQVVFNVKEEKPVVKVKK